MSTDNRFYLRQCALNSALESAKTSTLNNTQEILERAAAFEKFLSGIFLDEKKSPPSDA